MNIGHGDKTLLTLTTGPKGTVSGKLPVSSRKTEFWVKQIKAPEGYDLYKPSKTFTAGPGAPVTVTVSNSKTATTPKPDPSDKPTDTPSRPGDEPSEAGSGGSKPAPTGTSTPDADSSPVPAADLGGEATPKAAASSLAHTGADVTPWIVGGAGLLVAAGIGTIVATRRRTADERDDNGKTS